METDSTDPIPSGCVESGLKKSRGDTAAKGKGMSLETGPATKRRCVSTACIACRRRKSKCDGNLPSCAACSSVYHTPCVYDPNSDHRRKGVYRKDVDTRRARNATLQTLIQAILNYDEEDAFELVRRIRSCDDLEEVAESVIAADKEGLAATTEDESTVAESADQFESELSGKMSELVLDGSRKFIGGTSNLIFLPPGSELCEFSLRPMDQGLGNPQDHSVTRWTRITDDERLISHLMTMYFSWHYPFFTTLSKDLFYRDYVAGVSSQYCSSLLVNAMLALGCHFSSWEGAREDPRNSATAGDHFFKEAKRLLLENDEHENAKLCTVQAFALMSVREAGCGRESKGWVYSGMSFRMAFDLGLNLETGPAAQNLTEEETDARKITFWGCFLFDKCWSNYLGRQPQLAAHNMNVPKFEVLPSEEAQLWSPYTDCGAGHKHTQPSRTRTVALQLSKLSEISGDLLVFFYHPAVMEKPHSKQSERKKLTEIHTRLEEWKKNLPKELEPKEGQLPQALVMHMFYQLLFIHLYRPFLKYTKSTSPLPTHVSPRKLCVQAASAISKLLRLYKRAYGFNQIVNVAVYIAHTACTIHLLNLPEKDAQRDIIHGLKHLEEMGENWLCARRTIRILDISANKWQVDLPGEAAAIFERTHARWGSWGSWDQASSPSTSDESPTMAPAQFSSTAPSTYSSPGKFLHPAAQRNDSQMKVSVPLRPMTSYYPPIQSSSTPTALTSQRSASVQFQRARFALPEPTYLQPMTHISHPFQATPISQQDVWYNTTPEPEASRMNAGQATQLPTGTSPISNLGDAGSSLVQESQNWWSKDHNAWVIGAENWGGWSSGDSSGGLCAPATTFSLPYQTHTTGIGVGVGPGPTSSDDAGVLPASTSTSGPQMEPGMLGNDHVHVQLMGNFQE